VVKVARGNTVLGTGIGIVADRLIGDPPHRFDPMAAFEEATGHAAKSDATARKAGLAYAATGAALGASVGWGLKKVTGGLGSAALAGWSAIRGRTRAEQALSVSRALNAGDVTGAREALPPYLEAVAGEVDDGDLPDLVLAAVAEDTLDGVVGPALWAAGGGALGLVAYRALNGLDSVIGHHGKHHERAGPAGAAVDIVANLVPGYATAGLAAAVRPGRAGTILAAVRRVGRGQPSRGVAVAHAAYAAAVGTRSDDGSKADGDRPATPADIEAAVAVSRDSSLLLAALFLTAGTVAIVSRRRANGN
jgi:adenosylcobinamide-phosphate synthase